MKVCYFTNVYPTPSTTTMRREIHALERLGVEVVRVAARPFSGSLVEPEDLEEAPNTKYLTRSIPYAILCCCIVAATSPRRLINALSDAVLIGSKTKSGIWKHLMYVGESCVLLRIAQSCIHIHANFSNATSIGIMCRILGGPPISLRIHGPEEFTDFTTEEWNWKARHAAFIAPISEYGLHRISDKLPIHLRAKIKLLRCGIDLNWLKTISTANDSIPAQHQLVCVARLEPRKGHEILFEAISILLRDGLPVSLKLIGDGTLRDRLVQRAHELDLSGSIEFAGWGSGADVVGAMEDARLVVLPSYAEGLPIVLMEALALGRPVVATQIMGIPELVLNGRTGWLVPPRDAMMLASTLREALITPDDDLNRMADAGRSLVAKRHDTDKLMKELIDNISGIYPGSG